MVSHLKNVLFLKARNIKKRVLGSWYWLLTRLNYRAKRIPCVLCGHTTFTELSKTNRYNFPFTVETCTACGMGMQQPYPTREFLTTFYTKSYHHGLYWGTRTQPRDDREKRRKYLSDRLRLLDKELGLKGKKILDYGSGTGVLLEEAQQYDVDIEGIDIGKTPQGMYDLIVSIHVLEHLFDPLSALREVRHFIKDRGYVFFEVPDTEVRLKQKYFHVAHVTYFNKKTLRAMLEKAGYKVITEYEFDDCKSIAVLAS